jgi:ATP-dependent Zn protease
MGGGGRLARRVASAAGPRGVLLAPRRHLDAPAASTLGMVDADLKNLVNEAALLVARRGESQVTTADFSNSLEKSVLGMVRGIVLSSEERERTASHRTAWNVAPAAEELVDTEARKIIEECCGQALATLRGRRDRLDRLARTLLEGETLDKDDAYAAAGIDPVNRPRPDRTRRGAQHPPAPPQRRACLPRPHNQVRTGSRFPRADETG